MPAENEPVSRTGERPDGMLYYRLLSGNAGACGRLPPVDERVRFQEALVKTARGPNTYTTATHYSRYHLMILEAAVLI